MDLNCSGYAGPVKAVISDLAGTTVDFGSCAPAGAFVELFRRHGIEATTADARGPMGIHKKDHIQAMLQMPHIVKQWRRAHGHDWTGDDLEALYQKFIPMQLEALPKYGDVIPDVVQAVEQLRRRDIPVAVNTGYNREMLDIVLRKAAEGNFVPDAALCAFDVPKGRPAPWMVFRLMEPLAVYPPAAVVKVGDTIADIEEGLNAGVWTVGVTQTGNLIGLTQAELEALDRSELEKRTQAAERTFMEAGAHYVIESFADMPTVVEQIESRLHHA
jgi:phosphonoacetaldehyde hydrolase